MSAIVEIFKKAQHKDASHLQLLSKLVYVFRKVHVNEFSEDFVNCLKATFMCSADLSNRVDKVMEFAVSFIVSVAGLNAPETSVNTTYNKEKDERPIEATLFMYQVFNFLHESHRTTHVMIRKRICQFVAKFFESLGADALVDCNICDNIINIMTQRLRDKVPVIRVQAVLAVFRLQDRSDKNCPVTKSLLECIETDNCAEVRKLALSKLSVSQKSHVRVIIDRVNDISEKVRAETYVVLSKLHLKQLTIEERKRLLRTGLFDTDELVRNTIKDVLLPAWLKRMDDDILNLIKALDVDVESMDVTIRTIMALFENCSDEKLLATFRSCADAGMSVISYKKLCCESALFWYCYVIYLSPQTVDEKDNYRWDPKLSFDVVQAALLPDLSVFCEYIATYYNCVPSDTLLVDNLWNKREREFVLICLIELCKVYDYSDELGRSKLITLCLDLLRRVEIESIRPILELYFVLQTNLAESISKVVEITNDLLHPSGDQIDQRMLVDDESRLRLSKSCRTNSDASPDRSQHLKFKVAQLEVRLNELEETRDEAVNSEDYEKASELKREIIAIRDEIKRFENELSRGRQAPTTYDFLDNDDNEDDVLIVEDTSSDEFDTDDMACPLESIQTENVVRCLLILQEMLHLPTLKRLTPALRTLFQLLVLPACKSQNDMIAPLATEVLGSFCLRDNVLAKEYFTTFFALHTERGDVGLSALKVVFDLLLCFGPETFNISNLNEYETSEEPPPNEFDLNSISISDSPRKRSSISSFVDSEDEPLNDESTQTTLVAAATENAATTSISGYTFVSVLIDLLDDEWQEARVIVIHGLCKLMATGKLKSAKVLTRLLLLWFNPNSRESVEIGDCLNYFIPFFVKRCPWSVSLFENSFVPVLLTLLNAPSHSPLSEADPKMVMKVLCDMLSPSFFYDPEDATDGSIHGNLAVSICNAIIDANNVDHQGVLLKGLLYLDFSTTDASILTTLKNLAKKIKKKLNKKHSKKLLADAEKFKMKVNTVY